MDDDDIVYSISGFFPLPLPKNTRPLSTTTTFIPSLYMKRRNSGRFNGSTNGRPKRPASQWVNERWFIKRKSGGSSHSNSEKSWSFFVPSPFLLLCGWCLEHFHIHESGDGTITTNNNTQEPLGRWLDPNWPAGTRGSSWCIFSFFFSLQSLPGWASFFFICVCAERCNGGEKRRARTQSLPRNR